MSTISVLNNVNELAFSDFRATFRGQIIRQGDTEYDVARRVYNGMIDRRPAFIARCQGAADVISAVNFARTNNLELAVRSGGHNGAGLGTCDNGLVIDLSPMKGIRVHPASRTVQVEAGCTWGDVDRETHTFGLAVPSGVLSTTGVGGLTLGGGIGHLTRKYGLTIDNLLEVDIVLADGSFITANKALNKDLFWAVRGGGGNFGVVTSFTFQAHPVHTVTGGPILWPLEQAGEVLRWYREFILDAPEDLNGFFAFLTVPPAAPFPDHLHLKKMCGIIWCYTGPTDESSQIFAPIRGMGQPALYGIHEMPFPALQSALDGFYPPGLQWYWRADFVNEIPDKAIELHKSYGAEMPTPHSTMHLYPIDGAAHRVGPQDTAWSYRESNWAEVMVGVDPDPSNAERIRDWATGYWEALHPYSAGGAYINFMMNEGQERVKATYRDNYDRLAQVKSKYDPTNFFHINQNIRPA